MPKGWQGDTERLGKKEKRYSSISSILKVFVTMVHKEKELQKASAELMHTRAGSHRPSVRTKPRACQSNAGTLHTPVITPQNNTLFSQRCVNGRVRGDRGKTEDTI